MRGSIGDALCDTQRANGHAMPMGGISRVVESRHPGYRKGDLVRGHEGLLDQAVCDGSGLIKLQARMDRSSLALGALGMPGFGAYLGLLDIGQPKAGETVVVAAASGAVGSMLGQIAKLKGCRVIGIAGGSDKCRFAVEELGLDACIDRRVTDLAGQLPAACPKGIDVYLENTSGALFDAVLPLLGPQARVQHCGLIARYNDGGSSRDQERLGLLGRALLSKRIRIQGFIIFADYGERRGEFFNPLSAWLKEGKVRFRKDLAGDLNDAPQAFVGLLEDRNFDKLVVRVAND